MSYNRVLIVIKVSMVITVYKPICVISAVNDRSDTTLFLNSHSSTKS